MKKVRFIFLALMCVFAFFHKNANAALSRVEEDLSVQIKNAEEAYYKKHNGKEELSRKELDELSEKIQFIKEKYYQNHPEELKNFKSFDLTERYSASELQNRFAKGEEVSARRAMPDGGAVECGNILISYDQSTQIIGGITYYHGHAGICGFYYGNTIEANPGVGVYAYSSSRLDGYWRNSSTGGMYEVYRAQRKHYVGARNYGMSKLGTPYGFNVWAGQEYCSGLVFRAWKSQGFKLVNKVTYCTPHDLANSSSTYLIEGFHGSGIK